MIVAAIAMTAMPPTTPPTIAPTGVFEPPDEGVVVAKPADAPVVVVDTNVVGVGVDVTRSDVGVATCVTVMTSREMDERLVGPLV